MSESNAERVARLKRGTCPHCHHDAHFQQTHTRELFPLLENPLRSVCVGFYTCHGCGKQCLISWESNNGDRDILHDRGANYEVVLPGEDPRSLSSHVPEVVRSLYHEASIAEAAGALRAAGVMYRATVEAIAKEQGATEGQLYHKIEALDVAADLKTDLHEARLLGNYSIHDAISFERAEVEDVAELVEEACHVLYVQPQERATWRERRKARRERAKQGPASDAPDQG